MKRTIGDMHPAVAGVLVAAIAVAAAVVVVAISRSDTNGSTVRGSGVAVSQTRHAASFAKIVLEGSATVDVRVGGKQKIVVNADDNLVDRVRTRVDGGALVIDTVGDFSTRTPMTVQVTVPSLEALRLSGSGIITVEDVASKAFEVRADGSGLVRVAGVADRLDAVLSGSGDLQLGTLVAADVKAVVSGSGRLQVHADRTLDASIPGTGAIFYSGDASVTQSITGSGAILKA
jgi:hypothetical protein